LPNGGKMEVKISANLTNTKVTAEKALPEFALCSRNFYFDLGKELTEKCF
jgi:hypothetical protein